MSLRKLNSLIFVAAMLLAAVSCKKNTETETLPSLEGLYFECPSFVAPEQTVTLVPNGVKHPEGGKVGYYWKVTPTMSKADTVDVFVHKFSDTLKTYTVGCNAFAEGYYGVSYSTEVMVVKSGLNGSLTRTDIKSSDPKVTVDGIDYYYEKIGGLDWFRNNLAVTGSGAPYDNTEIVSDIFGRFYSYDEAMDACPEGWRLPTEEDWMSLADAIGSSVTEKYSPFKNVAAKLFVSAALNGTQILTYWPEVGNVSNSSRLSMIPFGYANLGNGDSVGKYPDAAFDGIFEYAAFWTADKVEGEDDMAYYRYMIANQPEMMVGKGDADAFGASVRCVRDAQ